MHNPVAVTRARTHRHPMRVVTRRTGLSAEILRVWERRYGVVSPVRTQTGRRLYSDAEIERLHLLYRATLGGRGIGRIASLSTAALTELVRQDAEAELALTSSPGSRRTIADAQRAVEFVEESLQAVEQFDPEALGAVLRRASLALPAIECLEHVVSVVLERVGTRWREGTLRPVHGHLAATVARRVLEGMMAGSPARAPRLVTATVTGQSHELGAMIAAAAAAAEGWTVTWLGANLPAADIAEAAGKLHARVVGLSFVHPTRDAAASEELRKLHALLPHSTELVVGGSGTEGYVSVLEPLGVVPIRDLDAFVERLRQIRAGTGSGGPAAITRTRSARRKS
jgi:methanogenic corrinoid protein MtbC1